MRARYYRFEPKIHKGVVYGHERIADMLPELTVLHQQHWEETERQYYDAEMKPDMVEIMGLERDGIILQFTARAGGEQMIGQLVYRLGRTYQHDERLWATEEGFYVVPEARGAKAGGVALQLLNYAEAAVVSAGARMICMGDKSPLGGPSLASLARRRGYKAVSIQYVKTIED